MNNNLLSRCRKGLVGLFVFAMIVSTALRFNQVEVKASTESDPSGVTVTSIGGWNETLYMQISGVTDSDVTAVSYTGPITGSLTGDDFQYLVRDNNNGVRIDIPGLKAGTYSISVTTGKGVVSRDGIVVEAQDRSGFAHFNYTAGVGAYNDDGTLKDNAIVLYVTNDNKNTVSVTSKDGTTVAGIGNILNSTGKDAGNGLNSKGGTANTNQDIIRKLASDGTPLVVRIIGNVTAPEGVTSYDSIDYGGTKGDNGFMARMQSGKDITIEGIGYDAVVNGWGFHFICQSNYPDFGKSFEVRNISFRNVPEDCVGMEGEQEGSTLTAAVERCWVHNCSFYAPSISNPAESDKGGGDGACDFKRGQYFTNSYCYYEGYHKTNLVGSSDSSLQYHLTYHHNYWKDCESRGPLARQADIHMYNNIFEGQTSYCMNPRANAYIFSEYNLFYLCKNPMQIKQGAIKSYNDSFSGCIEDNQGTVVTDKSTKVSSNCLYANFDTDESVSYIPSGNYQLQESIVESRKVIYALTGTMNQNPVDVADVTMAMLSKVSAAKMPEAPVTLPYSATLNNTYLTNKSATVDNIVFNVNKLNSDSLSVGSTSTGQDIVFNVNTAVNISMTDGGATYPVILLNEAGEEIITGTGKVYNVPAGTYYIQSSGFQTGDSFKYKESKISALSIEAYDPEAPTEAPTQKPTETPTETPSGGENPSTGVIVTGDTVHNFTQSGKESSFYSITGNLSTGKGTVTYAGLTLTQCLKIESSTNISFTAAKAGKLILVFNSANSTNIKVDGTKYTYTDGIFALDLEAGSHTITKADTANLFYMAFAYAGDSTEDSSEAPSENPTEEPSTEVPGENPTEEPSTEAPTNPPVSGTNGLVEVDGKYYYQVNGVTDTSMNGLILYEAWGSWVYLENGVWISDKYDFVEYGGAKFLVANGTVADLTGLVLFGDTWYYLAAGQLVAYTGLTDYDGAWFYVENGILVSSFNGIQEYDGAKFLVAEGRILFEYSGLYEAPDGNWYYIGAGKAQTQYTGLALYDEVWFYVAEGMLAVDYTGWVEYDGAQFYVENGMLK